MVSSFGASFSNKATRRMAAASRATLTGTRSGLQSMFANLRLACPVTVGARSPPLSGALLARSALQTGAAAHCAVLKVGGAAWRSSSPGMAAACGGAQHLGARSISSTRPRAAGLNDFFVSFPEVDKDGKPMFPAAGASRPPVPLAPLGPRERVPRKVAPLPSVNLDIVLRHRLR